MLIVLIGVLLMLTLPGDSLIKLITSGTILPVLIYAGTVVLYLCVRKKLEATEGAFSLGRFELPVAIVALAWLTFALGTLVLPSSTRTSDLIAGGMIGIGAVFFLGMYLFNREALETEPDDTTIVD